MSFFKSQGYLTITLDTGVNITGASTLHILYVKPNGTSGYFTGTLSGTTAITYQFSNADIDMAGPWIFQAYAVIGGLNAYGDKVERFFDTPLN